MYGTIVVATDGSDMATAALDHALGLAEAVGATVHAVIVLDVRVPPVALTGVPEPVFAFHESVREELLAAARAVMDRAEQRAAERGLAIETHIVEGVPARAIAEQARKLEADLIVMGTHGRSALGSLFLGSTAQAVLHECSLPLLLIRQSRGG